MKVEFELSTRGWETSKCSCLKVSWPDDLRWAQDLVLAHRYAIFLCSWDVERDDSLVGQLTIIVQICIPKANIVQINNINKF